jgi:hypothetical protein
MDCASTAPFVDRISPRGLSRAAFATCGFVGDRLSCSARCTWTNQAWPRISPNNSTMMMVSPVIRLFI